MFARWNTKGIVWVPCTGLLFTSRAGRCSVSFEFASSSHSSGLLYIFIPLLRRRGRYTVLPLWRTCRSLIFCIFRVSTGQGKVREIPESSKVRKSQGILILVREFRNFDESQGKVRDFLHLSFAKPEMELYLCFIRLS